MTMVGEIEMPWSFENLSTVIETLGFFLMMKDVKCNNKFIASLVSDISVQSFGMFFVHMVFIEFYKKLYNAENRSPPLMIPLICSSSFVSSYIFTKIISFLPFSHFIIG